MFCQRCGAEVPSTGQAVAVKSGSLSSVAVYIFAGLAMLSFIIFFATGLKPVYLVYVGLWTLLACHWYFKQPSNSTAAVVYLAIAIAGCAGYMLSRHPNESAKQVDTDRAWAQAFAGIQTQQAQTPSSDKPTTRKKIRLEAAQGKVTCSDKTVVYDQPEYDSDTRQVVGTIVQDDVVTIEGQTTMGEYKIRTASGRRGYVPSNCVDIQ
jgi:hypothetical protein